MPATIGAGPVRRGWRAGGTVYGAAQGDFRFRTLYPLRAGYRIIYKKLGYTYSCRVSRTV